jgi:hypothetical protein
MFPIQSERGAKPHPIRIPWSVAEKAFSVYSTRYGRDQSLERMAERGGFGPGEMDLFLPGWRDEVSEITSLRVALAAVTKERDEAQEWLKAERHEGQRDRDTAHQAVFAAEAALAAAVERATRAEKERDERRWMEDGGTWEDRAKAAESRAEVLAGALRECASYLSLIAHRYKRTPLPDDLVTEILAASDKARALAPPAAAAEGSEEPERFHVPSPWCNQRALHADSVHHPCHCQCKEHDCHGPGRSAGPAPTKEQP